MTSMANRPLSPGNAPRQLTDKYSLGYYPAYHDLALQIGKQGRVLEVGVAYGGSLMMWQELFPDGLIVGVDNDPTAIWPEGTVRIIADQDSSDMVDLACDASPDGYDLIIDDASHVGSLSEVTFELLWPLVKPGGWYILEDWPVAFLAPWAHTSRFGGEAMLKLVQSWVRLLEPAPGAVDYRGNQAESPGSGIAELWYRFGQAMLHKADT